MASVYRISTPVTGFSGVVAGVTFVNGEATVTELPGYFLRHGYKVEPLEDEPSASSGTPKSGRRSVKKAE